MIHKRGKPCCFAFLNEVISDYVDILWVAGSDVDIVCAILTVLYAACCTSPMA